MTLVFGEYQINASVDIEDIWKADAYKQQIMKWELN